MIWTFSWTLELQSEIMQESRGDNNPTACHGAPIEQSANTYATTMNNYEIEAAIPPTCFT